MTSHEGAQPAPALAGGEFAAQRLACDLLLRGCERALFDFALNADIGEASAGVDQRVAEIIAEILASWKSTKQIIEGLEGRPWDWDAPALDLWLTVDPNLTDEPLAVSRAWARYRGG